MIVGARVQQARELLGLTQAQLAERVNVNQSTIARVESGDLTPPESVVTTIAFQTGFPPSFFRREVSLDFPMGSLKFRARSTMRARDRQQAYQFARTIHEAVRQLMTEIEPLPVRVHPVNLGYEDAAEYARSLLGVSPDVPVQNLINRLEHVGVVVIALPIAMSNVDGFSGWADDRPVIVLSGGVPGDRLRLTVAHELGELMLPPVADLRERDRLVNKFAAALLLPEAGLRRDLLSPVSLYAVARLKPRWLVSMQTIILRARDLAIITDRQCRYLMAQMSERGWRTREPQNLDIPIERPRGIRQMAELLYGMPIDVRKFASELSLAPGFARELLEAQSGAVSQSPHLKPERGVERPPQSS
jgi:Zn-dependent peptidase ImmA (M78 family)/transcriptional regulator with XRE-family HTH domain